MTSKLQHIKPNHLFSDRPLPAKTKKKINYPINTILKSVFSLWSTSLKWGIEKQSHTS